MSAETYEVSYQGSVNERFKNAMLDYVMRPAYERAKRYEVLSEDPHTLEMRTVHQYVESGPVWVYTVYASKTDPQLDIRVSVHHRPSDMTWREAESIRADVLERGGVDERLKDYFRGLAMPELASLLYVSEARYEVDLTDRTLSVTNELWCWVNGEQFLLSGSGTELDEERQMAFDADEVVDIVRALHGTLLVEESQVREFLNEDF